MSEIQTVPVVSSSSPNILSNYKGSETTRKKVEDQIRQRYGNEAAESYDPLRNCLTFNLWRKAGYRVKKGEKALQSITIVEKKDKAGKIVQRYPKKICLFFKSQVEPIKTTIS